jgi:hypothetical protein
MHRLEDIRHFEIRYLEDAWLWSIYVHEVDENGLPTALVLVQRCPLLSPVAPETVPLYRCTCGYEFGSWEETKDHIGLGERSSQACDNCIVDAQAGIR